MVYLTVFFSNARRDVLTNTVRKDNTESMQSRRRRVGMGSREHDLSGAAITVRRTSSSVTSRQTGSAKALCVAAAVAYTAVDERTVCTLASRKRHQHTLCGTGAVGSPESFSTAENAVHRRPKKTRITSRTDSSWHPHAVLESRPSGA